MRDEMEDNVEDSGLGEFLWAIIKPAAYFK